MGNSTGSTATSTRFKRELMKLSWNIVLSLDHEEKLLDITIVDRKSCRSSRRSACRAISLDRLDSTKFAESTSSIRESVSTKGTPNASPITSPKTSPKTSPRALISSSHKRFKNLSNASVFHDEFKKHLFQFCPDLENRFPASFILVTKMLKSFIQKIIWGKCTRALVLKFVKSHATYKLKKEHFDGFGEAIASTIVNMLGPFGTFEICKIWREESLAIVDMLHKNYTVHLERNSKLTTSKDIDLESLGPSYMHLYTVD